MVNFHASLEGRRILIVEDEPTVALAVDAVLRDAGCVTVVAHTLDEAIELARSEQLDFAFLNFSLRGEDTSCSVAEILEERGIPFLFSTGHNAHSLPARYGKRPTLPKPFASEEMIATILRSLRSREDHQERNKS